jgi:hypothetical protein
VSLGTAPRPGSEPPEPPDGAPLSETEWLALTSLQAHLDLESPNCRALEVPGWAFIRRLVVWLRWLLDPEADGLPMPPLLGPGLQGPKRRRPVRTGRPPGA